MAQQQAGAPRATVQALRTSVEGQVSSPSPTQSLAAAPTNALHNFRLLEALRSDDPKQVQPFLDELSASSQGQVDAALAGKLLGMAVRVASVSIIHLILSSPSIPSPNLPVADGSEATALHVASEIGRTDVVQLLLNHPDINDTIRDEQGRTPLECASNAEVAAVIEESRVALQSKYVSQLALYIKSSLSSIEESSSMVEFLQGPRTDILNLNALDEASGSSLLHESARRRDLRLVELAVKRGADVFVRDKRGRRVLENEKGGDERIKVFLRQFTNLDNLVQPKSDGRPPDLKGFLNKWVNYRSGWRTRWFVLEDGVLSYYRNREDEAVACRGSISLASAKVVRSTDGSRFEVTSIASLSVPKIIVKSAHRGEIARWVQTITLNIEYYSQQGEGASVKTTGSIKRSASQIHPRPRTNASEGPSHALSALPPTDKFLNPKLQQTATGLSGLGAPSEGEKRSPVRSLQSEPGNAYDNGAETMSVFEAAENASLAGGDDLSPGVPHETTFGLGVLNIKAQIELTQQLVDSINVPSQPSTGSLPMDRTLSNTRQAAVKEALKSSLETLSTLITQLGLMSQDREQYFLGRIERETEARKLWEENMLTVAEQQADMDRQLTEAAKDNEKKRRALRQAKGVLAGLSGSLPSSPGPVPPDSGESAGAFQRALDGTPSLSTPTTNLVSSTSGIMSPPVREAHDALVAAGADSDSDNDDDDEFFDAIEQNAIPNLRLYESIAHPERPGTPILTPRSSFVAGRGSGSTPGDSQALVPRSKIEEYLSRQSLEPYLHVRQRLPIDDDQRPSVSLWSILKSSVGKDLTRISFPVSFNECTSMLQRMAEDMEYDACLTVAASEKDSLKRIAFVGAFAMSNYSSTIGRIAKPFNPLLNQTFEYAIPGRYRYISEQVSHHPPISACYSEAPTWKYYGEVDAQNKFQGRSFEIRPTGVAHCQLIIPKAWVRQDLEYPPAGPEYGRDDLVVEHYSWKKVTTNVSNFIMGSPIIDHYGDLVVTNHRTGETCTLTFKPRGWRGNNAFEIKGHVADAQGDIAWHIAGRWDTQLIARESTSSAPLDVNTEFKPSQKEYLLLWRNSEKPRAPFNLTPYAITLNDIPSGLGRYLCPTDCRLRTDQRAFENAEYDKAQMLKTANEEKQRATRKLRAEGKLPPHQPRWFTPEVDEDSRERVWNPLRDDDGEVLFWSRREEAGNKGEWEGVDHIFAAEADL